jgi:hypothetical protein
MAQIKPPGDNLPGGVISCDPTGGPQGPYFSAKFKDVDTDEDGFVTWKDICRANKHVWLEDEKRIDFLDMFGSLHAKITEDQMIQYIDRLKTDSTMPSKYGRNWQVGDYRQSSDDITYLDQCTTKHDDPFTHFDIKNLFRDDMVTMITNQFKLPRLFKREEKEEIRTVYTLNKNEYLRDSLTTEIINTILNKRNIHFLNTIVDNDEFTSSKIRHLFRLMIDYPGYTVPPHVDKNTLLTMLVYFPINSDTNLGTELLNNDMVCVKRTTYENNTGFMFINNDDTYHSFTKQVTEPRMVFTYNVYRSENDYIKIYDGLDRWNLINRARAVKEIKHNLFTTQEIVRSRFDWNNPRVIAHRKNKSYTDRFNKDQGFINYESLNEMQINELLEDQNLPTVGNMIERIHRLRAARQRETIEAEKTWNPDVPQKYMTVE